MIQARDETTGGDFYQITNQAVNSTGFPCSASGNCTYPYELPNKTHKYTFRIYMKRRQNPYKGYWDRSFEKTFEGCSTSSLPTNFTFDVGSSCVSGQYNQQTNTISMRADNTTHYKIKYWDNGWKHLITVNNSSISAITDYEDVRPHNTTMCYLVEAWNSDGYINANPMHKCAAAQNCSAPEPPPQPSPSCNNECSPSGKKTCVNSNSFKTCGNYDSDSCLEWSPSATSCGTGKVCSNPGGYCIQQIDLNEIETTCTSEEENKQNNHLSWTGELVHSQDFYSVYIKSPNTPLENGQNKFISIPGESWGNFTKTQYDHEYESIEDVFYKVNICGIGTYDSNEMPAEKKCGLSPPPPYTKPNKPTGLKAQAIDSDSIKLTWDAPGSSDPDVGYYEIYSYNPDRKAASSTQLVTLLADSDATSYIVHGLNCETEYSYYIIAGISDLKSEKSDTVSAKTGACDTGDTNITHLQPQNLVAQSNGNGIINLSWDAVEGATGYDIYDCNGNYIVSTNQTSYGFTGLPCSTDFCYYVVAHDGAGNKSQPSNQVNVRTEECGGSSASSTTASLISTGGALWFNILLSLLLTGALGYFLFRRDIWEKK